MGKVTELHEDFDRQETIKPGSDRNFGLVFAAFFAVLAVMSWSTHGHRWPWWLGAALLTLAIAIARPALLASLNGLWTRFGLLLFRFVSPVALALIYVTTIVPIGLYMRARGRDPLRLKRDPRADSYWITRQPSGPAPHTMSDQF
jgi:hypothetical protein